MKFQLIGKIKFSSEVMDFSGIAKLCEEFDAKNAKEANKIAQKIIKKLIDARPKVGDCGSREFRLCTVELREIKPIARISVFLKTVPQQDKIGIKKQMRIKQL